MVKEDLRALNRKYARQKMIRETIAAWLFLLPNFIGFLVITFLPIFATFFLAFTEWDGISWAKEGKIGVSFKLSTPAQQRVVISKGTVLSLKTQKVVRKNWGITVPYVLNKDVVIPAGETSYGLVDINALIEWNAPSYLDESGNPILTPKVDSIDASLKPYIKEGSLYFSSDNLLTLNPRLENPITGIGVEVNMPRKGKELGFTVVKSDKDIIIPKGTVIVVDLYTKKIDEVREKEWKFVLPKDVIIPEGKDEPTLAVDVLADEKGEIGTETYLIGRKLNFVNDSEKYKNITPYIKFVKATGNNGIQFVGIKNFKDLIITDMRFRDYLLNTFIFLVEIPLGMALSLIMALAMNQPLKGIVVFRVLYFLPVISNIVAIALLWRWILNPDYGFLNNLLRMIGVTNPPQWFANKVWARIAIIIVDVWKGAGYNMMLYLAGLQAIPHYLYEAAEIDGANAFQKFMNITWPLLGPTNFFILIMGIIGGFQAFGTQYVMTGGGPAGATTTIVYYIYNNAYQWFRMGYATAIAVVLFAIIMVFTILQWSMSEKEVDYQ